MLGNGAITRVGNLMATATHKGKKGQFTTIEVTGLGDLNQVFVDLPIKMQNKLERKAIREITKAITLPRARVNVHVRSGVLRRSLKVRAMSHKAKRHHNLLRSDPGHKVTSSGHDSLFRGEAFYGGFTEFGTKYQPAQGWMAAAYRESQIPARDKYARALKEIVQEEAQPGYVRQRIRGRVRSVSRRGTQYVVTDWVTPKKRVRRKPLGAV